MRKEDGRALPVVMRSTSACLIRGSFPRGASFGTPEADFICDG